MKKEIAEGGGCLVAQSCLTLVTPQTVARQAPLSMGFLGQEYWSGLPFLSSSAEDVRRQKLGLVLGTKPGMLWISLLSLPWGSQRRNTWLIKNPLLVSGASDLPLASKYWNVLYEWMWETGDQEIEWCCLHPWTQPAHTLLHLLWGEDGTWFFLIRLPNCTIPTATHLYTCVPRNSQRLGRYLLGLKLTGLPLTAMSHLGSVWAPLWVTCGCRKTLRSQDSVLSRMACYNPFKHTVPVIKQCMVLRDNKAIGSASSESSLDSVCTHRGTYYWCRWHPSPLM